MLHCRHQNRKLYQCYSVGTRIVNYTDATLSASESFCLLMGSATPSILLFYLLYRAKPRIMSRNHTVMYNRPNNDNNGHHHHLHHPRNILAVFFYLFVCFATVCGVGGLCSATRPHLYTRLNTDEHDSCVLTTASRLQWNSVRLLFCSKGPVKETPSILFQPV